ncbi:SGNH/GDSL hydrolase family protein [Planococcus soli]|uniref:SGNH/GDSL hydrolase family protein n=1 Tax=Planococcus soli TaxID=2666072 RepID=UPI00115E8842|nr:GDSL-type esterase/lipase family protein [Planococcus soli]
MINIRSGALFGRAPFLATKKNETALHIENIVILGDSVAYGYGTKGGIANYLKETFPASRITNLGINGLTSSGLVQKMRTDSWHAPLQKADLVLLNIGGNDLLRGFRNGGAKGLIRQFAILKRTYRQNLLEIYSMIRQANHSVIIVQNNLYNSMKKEEQYFGFTNLLFRLWNSAIGEKGVIVSKTAAMGKNPSIWLDSIHPNDEGYKLMHELLIHTLSTTGFTIHPTKK